MQTRCGDLREKSAAGVCPNSDTRCDLAPTFKFLSVFGVADHIVVFVRLHGVAIFSTHGVIETIDLLNVIVEAVRNADIFKGYGS